MDALDWYIIQAGSEYRSLTDATRTGSLESSMGPRDEHGIDAFTELLELYFANTELVFDDLVRSGHASRWLDDFETVSGMPLPDITSSLDPLPRPLSYLVDDVSSIRFDGCGLNESIFSTAIATGISPVDSLSYDEFLLRSIQWSMVGRFGERTPADEVRVEPDRDYAARLIWRSPVPADLLWDALGSRLAVGARQRRGNLDTTGAAAIQRDQILPAFSAASDIDSGFPENHAHLGGTVPQRALWINSLFNFAGHNIGEFSDLTQKQFRALMRWCRYVLLRLACHGATVQSFEDGEVQQNRSYEDVLQEHWESFGRAHQTARLAVDIGDELGLPTTAEAANWLADDQVWNFEALERRMVGSGTWVVFNDAEESERYRQGLLFSYLWIRGWFHRTATFWFAGRDAGLAPFMDQYDETTWATEAEGPDETTSPAEAMELVGGRYHEREDLHPLRDSIAVGETLERLATRLGSAYLDAMKSMNAAGASLEIPPETGNSRLMLSHAQTYATDLHQYRINRQLALAIFEYALAHHVSPLELRSTVPKRTNLSALLADFLPFVRIWEDWSDRVRRDADRYRRLQAEQGQALSILWPETEPEDADRYPESFGLVLTLRKGGPATWTDSELYEKELRRLRYFLAYMPDVIGRYVVGVDAAASERGAPPHLFKPHYQLASKHDLGRTFHAGEDYGDLLTGLRYVYEAVDHLECSRIGHGLALWESPASAYTGDIENRLERFERMAAQNEDDEALEKLDTSQYAGEGPFMGGYVEDLLDTASWLRELFGSEADPYVEAVETAVGRTSPDERVRSWDGDRVVGPSLDEVVVLSIDDSIVELAGEVQDWLRSEVADREIVVESCPQSNRTIGNMQSMREHPILTTFPEHDIQACVNTDDLGVFNTSLPVEYWRLYRYRSSATRDWETNLDDWLETGRTETFVK